MQAPALMNVATLPFTGHTAGVCDVYVTGNPDVAVAASVYVAPASAGFGAEDVLAAADQRHRGAGVSGGDLEGRARAEAG